MDAPDVWVAKDDETTTGTQSLLPDGAAGMPGQQTCAPPVIVTLPARLDAAAAGQAADQITAAFTPGVSIVIADLTAAARCDRSAIRNLLKAHRQATARGRQVRFAIRPGGPLHQITGFAGTHPLLAVYPTLQHALTGRSPIPPGNRGFPAAAIPAADAAGPRPAGQLRGGSGSHGMFSRTPRVVLNGTSRTGRGCRVGVQSLAHARRSRAVTVVQIAGEQLNVAGTHRQPASRSSQAGDRKASPSGGRLVRHGRADRGEGGRYPRADR